jgi:hypothetical protein
VGCNAGTGGGRAEAADDHQTPDRLHAPDANTPFWGWTAVPLVIRRKGHKEQAHTGDSSLKLVKLEAITYLVCITCRDCAQPAVVCVVVLIDWVTIIKHCFCTERPSTDEA